MSDIPFREPNSAISSTTRPGSKGAMVDTLQLDPFAVQRAFWPALSGFTVRMAGTPSAECLEAKTPSQDFLGIYQSKNMLCFVLCDGVSGSFFGEIAATCLGESLLVYLKRDLHEDVTKLAGHLAGFLASEARVISREKVDTATVPADLGIVSSEVLETRQKRGSEAMFVCGRIDLPQPGLKRGRLTLFWAGDPRLRIWLKEKEETALIGHSPNSQLRWSTREGLGDSLPDFYSGPLTSLLGRPLFDRLVAYSDGLKGLDKLGKPLSDEWVDDVMDFCLATPDSDDISLIDVWLSEKPDFRENVAPPTGLEVRGVNSNVVATWPRVNGASRYEVEINDGLIRRSLTHKTTVEFGTASETARLRMRAYYRGGRVSEWTNKKTIMLTDRPNLTKSSSGKPPQGWLHSIGKFLFSLLLILLASIAGFFLGYQILLTFIMD